MSIQYMSISVRGALSWPNRKLTGMFKKDGRRVTGPEARDYLLDQIAAGRETIPCAKHCANPCAKPGCKGFDFSVDGGCPGHDPEPVEGGAA